jgi:Leucine-rich repeat (LRR) protein/energy-coupling factor transporter ATP-binding protein EcfA2
MELDKFELIRLLGAKCDSEKTFNLNNKGFATIQNETFRNYSNLEVLQLNTNKFEVLFAEWFIGLENLRELFLKSNQIAYLDSNLFQHMNKLEKLHLGNNRIHTIQSDTFRHLTSLKCLLLGTNRISFVHPDTFKSLNKLEKLDLNSNKLSMINSKTFESLVNLRELHLKNNFLTSFEKNTFDFLINLTELYLDNNQLSSFEPNLLIHLVNLKYLYLVNNRLTSIHKDSFRNLENLLVLNLNSNHLSAFQTELFRNLGKLDELYLGYNRFSSIEKKSFTTLVNLVQLNLNSNEITRIEPEAFSSLCKLERLDLNSNKLTSIKAETFKGLRSLKVLILDGNELREIEEYSFDGLLNLNELSMSDLKCDTIDTKLFAKLENLKILRIFKSQLKQIKGTFQSLGKLEQFLFDSNQIEQLEASIFTNLKELKKIKIFGNLINRLDLDALFDNLTNTELASSNLIIFDISSNQIEEIVLTKPVKVHPNLKELYLNNNNLKRLNLAYLCLKFPNLEKLDLSNNNFLAIGELINEDFRLSERLNSDYRLLLQGNQFDHDEISKFIDRYPSIKFRETSMSECGHVKSIDSWDLKQIKQRENWQDFNPQIEQIEWPCVPMFALLTGKNGVGKTSILRFIKYKALMFNENKGLQRDKYLYPIFFDDRFQIDEKEIEDLEKKYNKSYGNILDPCSNYGTSILRVCTLQKAFYFLRNRLGLLNIHLQMNKFKYKIRKLDERKELVFRMCDQTDQTEKLYDIHNLTPGEQIILLLLTWQYIFKRYRLTGKMILLFDELDSHLHPSAVREILDILKRLVQLGVQLIMSTHSPTTVSLMFKHSSNHDKIVNQNVFLIENDNLEKKLTIIKKNEFAIMNELASNLISVLIPFRLIHVEASNDALFYNNLKNKLILRGHLTPNFQFLFQPLFGSSKVKQICNFIDESNKNNPNPELTSEIRNLILGIIDNDGNYEILSSNDDLTMTAQYKIDGNLCHLLRHSLENYILDPINFYFYLKYLYIKSRQSFLSDFKTKLVLNQEQFDSLNKRICEQLANSANYEREIQEKEFLDLNSINDLLKSVNKIKFMNAITKTMANMLVDFLTQQDEESNFFLFKKNEEEELNFKKLTRFFIYTKEDNKSSFDSFGFFQCLKEFNARLQSLDKEEHNFHRLLFPHNHDKAIRAQIYNEAMLFLIEIFGDLRNDNNGENLYEKMNQTSREDYYESNLRVRFELKLIQFLKRLWLEEVFCYTVYQDELKYAKIFYLLRGHFLEYAFWNLFFKNSNNLQERSLDSIEQSFNRGVIMKPILDILDNKFGFVIPNELKFIFERLNCKHSSEILVNSTNFNHQNKLY